MINERCQCVPFVTTAFEFRTRKFLIQLLPVGDFPVENLKVLDVEAHAWHVLRGERIIC